MVRPASQQALTERIAARRSKLKPERKALQARILAKWRRKQVMKKMGKAVIGNWRITGTEVWDADYFDMEVPAYLTIRKDLTGEFQFGLVRAQLDGKL